MSEKNSVQMVNRSAVVALVIVSIILVAGFAVLFTQISDLDSKITGLQNQMASQNTTITSLNSTIESQNATITSLNSTIESQNATITSLNSTIQSQNTTITSLNSTIESQNATITSLLQATAYPLPPANTYFAISGQAAIFRPIGSITNASNLPVGGTVLIEQLGFYFTPIWGPATDIRIFIQGESEIWWTSIIPQGNTAFTGVLVPLAPIPSTRQSDGNFTFSITLLCDQASGTIVIQFTPDELFTLY